jgi:hypothetical protein
MRLATILTSICLLAPTTTADAAKWETKGSEMWGACDHALRPHDKTNFNAGLCSGTINAVVFLKDDICMPEGVSREQATRVVVRYFVAHPELLHLDGVSLVHAALHETWPCQR